MAHRRSATQSTMPTIAYAPHQTCSMGAHLEETPEHLLAQQEPNLSATTMPYGRGRALRCKTQLHNSTMGHTTVHRLRPATHAVQP